jgi:hypothetical protein
VISTVTRPGEPKPVQDVGLPPQPVPDAEVILRRLARVP